ncbi:unnamed protein product [Pleuronectes platessa]|uniref:Uncharacterized protein n=1 Tax=Pleuronectes platessa TaxID=8262 RepID=A0A9N7UWA9_PLEPL|nr:unnamed protein product [Pleuronectes platessa]
MSSQRFGLCSDPVTRPETSIPSAAGGLVSSAAQGALSHHHRGRSVRRLTLEGRPPGSRAAAVSTFVFQRLPPAAVLSLVDSSGLKLHSEETLQEISLHMDTGIRLVWWVMVFRGQSCSCTDITTTHQRSFSIQEQCLLLVPDSWTN